MFRLQITLNLKYKEKTEKIDIVFNFKDTALIQFCVRYQDRINFHSFIHSK